MSVWSYIFGFSLSNHFLFTRLLSVSLSKQWSSRPIWRGTCTTSMIKMVKRCSKPIGLTSRNYWISPNDLIQPRLVKRTVPVKQVPAKPVRRWLMLLQSMLVDRFQYMTYIPMCRWITFFIISIKTQEEPNPLVRFLDSTSLDLEDTKDEEESDHKQVCTTAKTFNFYNMQHSNSSHPVDLISL